MFFLIHYFITRSFSVEIHLCRQKFSCTFNTEWKSSFVYRPRT